MVRFLPAPARGTLVAAYLVITTVITCVLMIVPAFIKWLFPKGAVQAWCNEVLGAIGNAWVAGNGLWLRALYGSTWDLEPVPPVNRKAWYLIIANHQSWVDVLVLQRHFHGRIPFLKFFIKQELIWVPLLGLAWWALDFPFMKRGKGRAAHRNDIEATRAACEKFQRSPTSVINFLEGGRYTAERAQAQATPYRHLLKPHVGGMTTTLATMGDRFDGIIDVTLAYPDGVPQFWDLMCGRATHVCLHVAVHPLPAELRPQTGLAKPVNRHAVSAWIDERWAAKDATLARLLNKSSASS